MNVLRCLMVSGLLAAGVVDAASRTAVSATGHAALGAAYDASGGDAWRSVNALLAEGRIVTSGMDGMWSMRQDTGTGAWRTDVDVGVFRSAEGSDGRAGWRQDPSGGVHPLDGAFARRQTITNAWMTRRAWDAPDAAANIGRAVSRRQGGQSFAVVEAVPHDGQPITLWFDAKTHLLDRTVSTMPTSVRTVRYGDYRAVGALRLPFTIETRESGSSDVDSVRVERCTTLPSLDAAAFDAPRPPDDTVLAQLQSTIPMQIDGNIIVTATLNGQAYDFILDTGGHNIITPEVAAALGVQPVGAGATGGSGSGQIAQQFVRIDRLQIGDAVMRDQHFYVIPMQYGTLERGARPLLAGLLGLEIFERFAVRIDYPGKAITLQRKADYAHRGSGVAVPITFDDDMPLLDGRIDGAKGVFALDTGNSTTLIVQHIWAKQHGLADRLKRGVETVSFGVGGASRNWASRAASIDVAGTTLHDRIVRYAEDTAGAFSSRTEAANIGTDVLSNFIIDVDYAGGVIWFEYVPGYVPLPFGRAGLRAIKEAPESFRVAVVSAGSQAALAGIAKDDRIVAVDNVAARDLSGRDLNARFSQPAGTVVTLDVRRGTQTRTVRLALKELLP